MMDRLIDSYGNIDYGLIREPVRTINFEDFSLKTPTGRERRWAKKLMFKQFSFVGLNCPEIMVGVAVVDLKYAANAFFYVFDKQTRALVEEKKTTLPGAVSITPRPEDGEAFFNTAGLRIRIAADRVTVKSKTAELEAVFNRDHVQPLRICTRTGYTGWTYTQKTAPIPVFGTLRMEGRTTRLTADTCLAVTDWTAGFFRRETFWNWAAAAHVLPDGRLFGMNFSCGVNETEATENVFWIDAKQVKIDNVKFSRPPDSNGEWHMMSADGKVDLVFKPLSSRREHLNFWIVTSKFTQFLGVFSGRLTHPQSGDLLLDNCPGWAEDHYAKW